MNDRELEDALRTLLEDMAFSEADDLDGDDLPEELSEIERVKTFEAAGVLTDNAGLVITLADHTQYQLTIVRSR